MYKAHIRGEIAQSCKEHSRNSAEYSRENLKGIALSNVAYLSGLIHDVGKFTMAFNDYIEASSKGLPIKKGKVIHSFAGVRLILEKFHSAFNQASPHDNQWASITSELISIAVGSHHGLFDCYDETGKSGLDHRMKKQPDYDAEAMQNFFSECASEKEIEELFSKSSEEVEKIIKLINSISNDQEELMFYLGLLERLLCATVMDGDRRDTAEFMSSGQLKTHNYCEAELNEVWGNALINVEKKINAFPNKTEIDQARKEMSDYCNDFGEKPSGIYRLTLPTGGGKTLSSLRYALKHAIIHKKKKIIFTIPLLSILEQNAKVIREAINDDDIILEHHSDVIVEDASPEECLSRELLIDTWNSPIIITTLVQLLNVLFNGKTSSVRRLSSLCDSIIIIDEVQSVPENMLTLFNLAVNFLAKVCNVTFILCSATQPSFELLKHKMLVEDVEIIPEDKKKKYSQIFKRNHVSYNGILDVEEICILANQYFSDFGSVLIITNTKKEASIIFQKMRQQCENCFHLSTSMCMAHRKEKLQEIKEKLDNKERIICVSTQLIEAGVDISFGSVIRLMAGMDSVVQAAGRCNRNGESNQDAPVSIVFLKNENLSNLRVIKQSQDYTGELISEYNNDPDYFGNDLFSYKSINYYYNRKFRKLNNIQGYTEYVVDDVRLFDLLTLNEKYTSEMKSQFTMRQAFKMAGEKFEVFDSSQLSVIVPFKNGEMIIHNLLSDRSSYDFKYAKMMLDKAKEYTVNIFQYQYDSLKKSNALFMNKDKSLLFLNPDYYDTNLGIIYEEKEENEWNTLIL